MRIFAVFALLATYVAAKGSGPYLPSGWKPEGPAFYLPSEVEKPKENPVKDIIYQGSEASGSDSFQEYGPPNLQTVFLELSKQGLPDAVTEQTFAVVGTKVNENKEQEVVTEIKEVIQDSEANLSQQSIVQEIVPVTESLALVEGATTVAEAEEVVGSVDIQPGIETTTTQLTEEVTPIVVDTEDIVKQSVSDVGASQETSVNEQQDKIVEIVQQENENANSNIVSTLEERVQAENVQTLVETEKEVQRVETEVQRIESEVQKIEAQVQNLDTEVKVVEHVVQNIPELLNNIDNEIKQQQVENVQQVTEANVNLETFGSLEQAPEGFLEYGPPGFKEYGPPKELKSTTDEIIIPKLQTIETNETRKRRFSPKFRTVGKVNKH